MSLNKSHLIGNVCQDPEVITFDNGNKLSKFSLATNETYKNKSGEKVTDTDFHNIVIYGKLTEIVEKYVVKGQLLYIEGKIKTKSWEDKDGNKRYTTEIVCNELKMFGKKAERVSEPEDTDPF